MKKSVFSVFLILSVLLPCFFRQAEASYEEYRMKDFAKNALPGARIVFYEDDFLSNIIGDGELSGIVPTSLPASDVGVLKLEGSSVVLGSIIPADKLDRLVFIPASAGEYSAVFSFTPLFKGAQSLPGDEVDVTLNFYSEINNAPAAANLRFKTQKNLKIEIPLSAYDPENDGLAYTVVGIDGPGELSISGKSLVFTPKKNKTGKTVIYYYAKDSYGNTSDIASVTVSVEKPGSAIAYDDLSGRTSAYAAIKMAEAGVYVGERYGNTLLIHPEKEVSRGEFLVLAMNALGLEPSGNVILHSEQISSWQGAYMATALELGLIDDAAAGEAISGDEAASVIAKLLGLDLGSSVAGVSSVGDMAKYYVDALGIITKDELFSAKLTRGDAIEIIYRLTEVCSGTPFGWKTLS